MVMRILYDSAYVKALELSDSSRLGRECGLPGAGAGPWAVGSQWDRVPVVHDKKSFGGGWWRWSHNDTNVPGTSELCTQKWLRC